MALCPSSGPQRVVLLSPHASSVPHVPDPESYLVRTASSTVTCLLATVVTDPSFDSAATSALVAELADFASLCRLDYAASLVFYSSCPPSAGGELALGCYVLEDRQFELECLAAAAPHLASTLLCPERDPDALDIPTPRTYAEAITGSVTLRVGESLFDHTSGVSTAPAATAKSTLRATPPLPLLPSAASCCRTFSLTLPVEVAVDSGAARGAEPAGAGTGGAEHGGAEPERVESGGSEPPGTGSGGADPGGAEPERVEPGGAEPERVEPGGAKPGGTASWGAEPARAESGGSLGDPLRREPLSPQRLREWYARHCSRAAGGTGPAAGSAAGARATGGAAGAGAAGGAPGAGAAGGAAGAGAAGGAAGAGAAGGAAGVGAVGTGAGGAAGVVTRDPGAEGTGAVSAVFGGAARPRPYYVPLLQQILGLQPSSGPTTLLLSPPPVQSQSQFQPVSPLPGPSPYSGPTRGLTERREPESRPVLPESRPASLESRSESSVHTRVPLASPPASSLLDGPDPEFNSLRAASPTVTCFLATAVTC
ncbi:unnamed protein product [Closterium sp. NIES-53]